MGLNRGIGIKVADNLTIPVCARCHAEIHANKNSFDQMFYALKTLEAAFNSEIVGFKK